MSMEAVVERKRKQKRRMKKLLRAGLVALRQKSKERQMLRRRKQSMLAEQAAKENMVAYFMDFIEAIDKNDMVTAQNFDERAMKNTILSMMNGGGFAADA